MIREDDPCRDHHGVNIVRKLCDIYGYNKKKKKDIHVQLLRM